MTEGQLWLTRRISEAIDAVEKTVDKINPHDYDIFEHFLVDVYDEALSRIFGESATEQYSDSSIEKYLSIFSAMKKDL